MELTFRNLAGHRLAASLELPEQPLAEPPPVVIFAHGFGSGRTSGRNRAIAERLLAAGVATLLIDFTGHGDSEGDIADATIEQMVEDLGAAVDFLETRPEIDPASIGISGSSSGGIVTVLFAARDPRASALVLRSVPAGGLFEAAAGIEAPTLVIAGALDVPIAEEDRALAEALAGEHEFAVIPGAGHLYEGPGQSERVAELSAAWFVEKLRAPARA
jgi:pimeloyl-ACP methyl ester carboxylesterase